jgi:hypothetical protein
MFMAFRGKVLIQSSLKSLRDSKKLCILVSSHWC